MKRLSIALILCLSVVGAQPAMAKANYSSIQCLKFVEGDWSKVKPKLIHDLEAGADKNQKMLIEDVSEDDLVVAGTNLYCEGLTVQQTLEWIGL